MLNKKIFILFLLLFSLVFYSCNNSKIIFKKDITVAQSTPLTDFNPYVTNDLAEVRVNSQIFSSLFTLDDNNTIKGNLVKKWYQLNHKEWLFTLRENIYFHNGVLLTSQDVKYSIDKMLVSTDCKGLVQGIDHVKILNRNSFIISLKDDMPMLLFNLTHPSTSIVPKGYNELNDGSPPIGSGPFQFFSNENNELVLTSYKNYFGEKASIDKLTFKTIPKHNKMIDELIEKKIDIAIDIPISEFEYINHQDYLKAIKYQTFSTDYLYFNTSVAPYNDLKFRELIRHLINVELIQDLTSNTDTNALVPIINSKLHNPISNIEYYTYDLEKAQNILDTLDINKEREYQIWVNNNPVRISIANRLKENFAKIGIKLKVSVVDWTSLLSRSSLGEHEMIILGWNSTSGSIKDVLFPLFHSASIKSGRNRSFYSNEEVDNLINLADHSEYKQRQALFKEAVDIIAFEIPAIPLYHRHKIISYNKNKIKSLDIKANGIHDFSKIELTLWN